MSVSFTKKKAPQTRAKLDIGKWPSAATAAVPVENPAPYQVQIITNADATRYQITIQPEFKDKSTWCRTAAVSDDRGVIFLGHPMGCPASPPTPR